MGEWTFSPIWLFVYVVRTYVFSPTYILAMERHTHYVPFHVAPFIFSHSQPPCNFLINCNTHEYCITMSLEEACTRKLPPQWNDKKCVAQKNKRQRVICECVLYKYFKSKWKKSCCIDLYWYLQVSTHYRETLFCASLDVSFLGGTFLNFNNVIIKNTFTF
jgi:hypothetical protein